MPTSNPNNSLLVTNLLQVTNSLQSANGLEVANLLMAAPAVGYTGLKTITIQSSQVPANQVNFPVLVTGTFSYLKTVANGGSVTNSSGFDVIFSSTTATDGSGKLPFEVQSYNATTGAVTYWVKVPAISSSSNTVIYLLYGNSAVTTDQSNKTGVWDSNFKLVWHMNQASGAQIIDSTSNNNNSLTNSGTQVAGQFDHATQFISGSSQSASLAGLWASNNNFTFSTWINVPNTTNYGVGLEARTSAFVGALLYTLITSGKAEFFISSTSSGVDSVGVAADGTWHYIAGTYDGATQKIYLDNTVNTKAQSDNLINWGTTWYVAEDSTSPTHGFYSSSNQELRVSNIPRTANWLLTEYNNQSNPGTFYTIT